MDIGDDIWLNIALHIDTKRVSDLNSLCSLYCVNKSANRVLSSCYFWKLKYADNELKAPNDVNLSLREYYVHYKASYYESILNLKTSILVNTQKIVHHRFTIDSNLQSVLDQISTSYTHVLLFNNGSVNNGVEMRSIEISAWEDYYLDIDKYTCFLLLQYFIMCKFKMYSLDTLDRDFNPLIVENTQDKIKFIN